MLHQDSENLLYQIEDQTIPSPVTRMAVLLEISALKVIWEKKTYLLFLIGLLSLLTFVAIPSHLINLGLYIGLLSPGNFFSFILLPLVTLILGISAIVDEKESRTISHLFARPIGRHELIFSKWIVANIMGFIITTAVNVLVFFAVAGFANDFSLALNNLDLLLSSSIFLGIYVATYTSIFLFVGTIIEKNALVIGLIIAYFEVFFSQFIFGLGMGSEGSPYSITNHLYNIASEYLMPDYLSYSIINFEPIGSIGVIAGLILLSFLGAMVVIRMKDLP